MKLLPLKFSCLSDSTPDYVVMRSPMVPKKKRQGALATVIPPINPNSQLPFCGNYASLISESDLLHLV
jgi:hypothetical protein